LLLLFVANCALVEEIVQLVAYSHIAIGRVTIADDVYRPLTLCDFLF